MVGKRFWSSAILAAAQISVAMTGAVADEAGTDEDAEPKIRFRMPKIVMMAHADWPKDPKYWDEMAKYVVSNGFNVVEAGMDVLDVCRKHGLMVRLGGDQETLNAAVKLRGISDRRRRSSFPYFPEVARVFEKAHPTHPTIFINRAAWNEFGAFAEEVKPMLLDFYHYHRMPRRYPDRYYLYLFMFRYLGLKNGIPAMRCTSSDGQPSQLRQTIYTSLAYGVTRFRFWTPWIFARGKDKDGNAELKDGRLNMYVTRPSLCEIAKEVKWMSPVLIGCRSVDIHHSDPLPISGHKSPEDAWCQLSGSQLLVGLFEGEERGDFLLVANKDSGQKHEASLSFHPQVVAVEKMNKKTGVWEAMSLQPDTDREVVKIELPPGDGELLRVNRVAAEQGGYRVPAASRHSFVDPFV